MLKCDDLYVERPEPRVTYYIAVTAYDTANYESDYSNEVSGQITETVSLPPVLGGSTSGTTGISNTYTTGGSSSNLGHSWCTSLTGRGMGQIFLLGFSHPNEDVDGGRDI